MAAYTVVLLSPLSSNYAAFLTMSLHYYHFYLDVTKSEAISAYLNWRYWKSDNFLPNCFRVVIYFLAAYRQKAAPPKLQLAILLLPPSNAFIAILNPIPSEPIKFAAGTLTLSKVTRAVGWMVHPIFYYFFPYKTPFISPVTTKVET